MAKKVITRVTDDLDGTEGADTVQFGLDGVSYLIDLCEPNSDRLREVLAPYIAAGQKVGRQGRTTQAVSSGTPRSAREENQRIREWAVKNGYEIADRGRIAAPIAEAYRAAA